MNWGTQANYKYTVCIYRYGISLRIVLYSLYKTENRYIGGQILHRITIILIAQRRKPRSFCRNEVS